MVSRVGLEPTTLGLKVRCKIGIVNAFIKDKTMSGLSPRTIAFYEEKLAKLPQDDSLLELTKDDLQELLYSMSCGQGGKQAHLRAFKALFNWIEDSGLPPLGATNPCRNLKIKVPKPLRYAVPVEDIPTLLEACNSLRDKLIVALLADTGMRLSELSSVQTADIDFANQQINIWGKGSKQRTVRYGDATAELMHGYEPSETYLDMTANAIRLMLDKLGKRTGIKCNAHSFRRTFATESVRNGMNLFHVQSLLGHSTLNMTRLYAHQVDSTDAVKAYKPIIC